jgi:hypothetical protein
MALGTVLWELITSITAVILAITEQPLGDASVVGRSWTTLPPSSAVTLPVSVKNTYVSALHSFINTSISTVIGYKHNFTDVILTEMMSS